MPWLKDQKDIDLDKELLNVEDLARNMNEAVNNFSKFEEVKELVNKICYFELDYKSKDKYTLMDQYYKDNKEEIEKNEFNLSPLIQQNNKIKKIDKGKRQSLERSNNIKLEMNGLGYNNKFSKNKKYLENNKFKNNNSIDVSNESENKRLSNFDSRNYSIRKESSESNNNKSRQSKYDYYYYQKNKANKKPILSHKTNIELYLGKNYYYPQIFRDFEELVSNSIFCINGRTFNYLYENKNRKDLKHLIKQIYNNCKIFYKMSSLDKSLVVEFFDEYENNCVCYIGKTQSDSDAIMSSGIGISFEAPRNQNTILSHFYVKEANISCIKNLILQGKSINENIKFAKISIVFCTMIVISYILCCFICHIEVMIGELNALEISLLILSIGSFTIKHRTYLKKTPFTNKPKLFTKYYIVLTIGLFLIKLTSIYLLVTRIINIQVPL